jgi:hypothetical protein
VVQRKARLGCWDLRAAVVLEVRNLRGDAMTEAEFTDAVLEYAKITGWRSIHLRPAKTEKGCRTAVQGDGKGFPDLLLIRGDRLVIAELKSDTGRPPKGEQMEWLRAFHAVTPAVYTWRPSDWADIEVTLT